MKKIIIFILPVLVLLTACNIVQTYQNITRLKFKLGNVDNVTVANINVSGKNKLADFNPMDILKLTSTLTQGEFPISFVINVEAKNPSEGTGGGVSDNSITLKSFPFKLFIDDVETISGNINEPVYVPSKGENKIIPITVGLDLKKFFKDKGLDKMVNLVLALGGKNKDASKIKLVVRPTIGTPIGDFKYPNEITVVSYQFN
ncbi:MAG TPA: hypothetical protein PL041_06185 [Melioribacteraceae bacterium]|nr:hypothetical protein [Melioribacteraceae bacterium]